MGQKQTKRKLAARAQRTTAAAAAHAKEQNYFLWNKKFSKQAAAESKARKVEMSSKKAEKTKKEKADKAKAEKETKVEA
jgi:hypothetical protein